MKFILIAALITEGIITAFWAFGKFVWPGAYGYGVYLSTADLLAVPLLACLPLMLANYLLFIRFPNDKRTNFINNKIIPLCERLDFKSALIVSCMAGLGEELFFRDFLLSFISEHLGTAEGIIISSFAFAYLHFISKAKEHLQIVIIYFFVGVYFSLLLIFTHSIFTAVLAHAFYDFIAIMWIRSLSEFEKVISFFLGALTIKT